MADLEISIDINASRTKTGADVAKSALKGIGDEAGRMKERLSGINFAEIGRQLQSFGSQLQGIGTQLAISVTAPLVLAGKAILSAGAEYEKGLNIFQAVTKATSEEMVRAAQVAKDLGADLSLPATSAKDAAVAMNELGKAGLTAAQAMDAAKGVLQLAAAGQLEEARAAEIAANALNAFRLEASETVRVANLLAAAANASSAEVNDIALSMQQASASFSSAKIPIEDLITSISALANAGIKGSDAGTSLKTFMISLQAPTTKAAEVIKELGITVFDTAGQMRGLPDIIGQFETALAGLTDEQKVNALNQIFGSDAIRAAQILFATGTEGFAKLKEQVTASGAAAELANARMKGLGGAWEGFKSQLETVGIEIYEVVKAPLTSFLQSAAAFVSRLGAGFQQLSPTMQQAIIAFVALAAAAGPLLIILGGVVAAVGTLVSAAVPLGIALLAIVGAVIQLGPVLAIVAAETYVLYTAWETNFGGIRDLTIEVATAIQNAWNAFLTEHSALTSSMLAQVSAFWAEHGEEIKATLVVIEAFVREKLTAIRDFWNENSGEISSIVRTVWALIKILVTEGLDNILLVIRAVAALIRGDWKTFWDSTASILKNVLDIWVSIMAGGVILLVKAVRAIFIGVFELKGWVAEQSVAIGVAMVEGIIKGIVSLQVYLISTAAGLIKRAVTAMKEAAKIESPSKVTEEIGKFMAEGVAVGMDSGAGEVAKSAKGLAGTISEILGGDIGGFLRNAFDVLTDGSRSWGDRLKTIFGGIMNNFRDMVSNMASNWLSSIFGGGQGGGQGGGIPGIGPGGTGGFNPGSNGGVGFPMGGFRIPGDRTGTIDAAGNYVVDGRSGWKKLTGAGGFFGEKGFGNNVGTYGAIGGVASMVGGAVGGRAGGFISNIGSGMALGAQIGSIIPGIGTAIGAVVGGAVGFLASLFGGDPKRKKDKKENIPALNRGFTDAMAELRALIGDVRTLRVSPDSAIARATELRNQIASGFGIQFESKKYKKQAATMIASRVREADTLIAELRNAAEIANAAGERQRRLIPEFATGIFMSREFTKQLGNFKRMNGLMPGKYSGKDTINARIGAGEMVLNPMQQRQVRSNAGLDPFRNAGIPGYAGGIATQTAPAATASEPMNFTFVFEQNMDPQGMVSTQIKNSPDVKREIRVVVEDLAENDRLKLKRRGA